MDLHERGIEGKIEENEENRGFNDKKAYRDQFMAFFSGSFC